MKREKEIVVVHEEKTYVKVTRNSEEADHTVKKRRKRIVKSK